MSAAFNVNQYWQQRGESYFEEALPQDYHRLQERFLFEVLRAGNLPMDRVLELGCGFGRITRLLARRFPRSSIHALDLSVDQLAHARQQCAGFRNITFNRHDLCSDDPFPAGEFDTAIAVEVFLHQQAETVLTLYERLRDLVRFIVHIDWSEDWRWATPEHAWVHDYRRLFDQAALKCVAFNLPEKVDGLQQQLFVGGRELTPELIELEQAWRTDGKASANVSRIVTPVASGAQWLRQLHAAAQDIQEAVPRGSVLILVDEDTWGNPQRLLPGRRVLPFLERDGAYWGPPADDQTAIAEIERMRAAGASHFAVTWNASWWLQHYRGFHQHLRNRGRCVLVSDHVVVFEL